MQITRQIVGWASLLLVTALVATSGLVAQEDPAGIAPPAVDAAAPACDPITSKRRELLELITRKISLMNDAELEQALIAARTELTEIQAAQRVRDAERVLSGVVEEFPQTQAAQKARHMLSPPPQERLVPTISDDGFAPARRATTFTPNERPVDPALGRSSKKLVPMPETEDAFEEIRPATPKPARGTVDDSFDDPLSPNINKKSVDPTDDFGPAEPAAKPAVSGLSRSRLLRTSLPIPNPASRP